MMMQFSKLVFANGLKFGFLAFLLSSCGSEESQLVQKFVYSVDQDQIRVGVEFNQSVELNTDVIVPIKNYGDIRLIAPTKNTGFQLSTNLNLSAFVDPEFLMVERTRLLPNGQPMSLYVESDVARIKFQPDPRYGVSLYLGLEESMMYLGGAIELGFLDANFPAGLVISQRIQDASARPLGVISLYGPKVVNGQLVAPGGLFFITNITDLISYGNQTNALSIGARDQQSALIPDQNPFISEIYKETYSKPSQLRRLHELFQKQGKKAGLVK